MNIFFNKFVSSGSLASWEFLSISLVALILWLYFTGTAWSIFLLIFLIYLFIYSIVQGLQLEARGRISYLLVALCIGVTVFPIFNGHDELIKFRYRLELELRRVNFEAELISRPNAAGGPKTKTWKSWNGSSHQFFLYTDGKPPLVKPSIEDKYQCSEYGTRLACNFFLLATNCG
jgi:hypothetical protein